MVFWITFKQMKYFDYFRFIHPTINHTYEEELLFENIIPSILFEKLKEKMNSGEFRFMKILCEEIDCNEIGEIYKENFNVSEYSKFMKYNIKLYKLSNIFQYLSVIEINIPSPFVFQETATENEIFNIENGMKNCNINIKNEIYDLKKTKFSDIKRDKFYTKIKIKSQSASFLPAFFPFGFLIPFLPFLSFFDYGCNKKYVNELKNIFEITEKNKTEKTENCVSTEIPVYEFFRKDFFLFLFDIVPPSSIFFVCFILFPVCCAAICLLSMS